MTSKDGSPCWTRGATCGLTVRLTVAVPGVRLGGGAPALHTDRCQLAQVASSATSSAPIAPYLLRYAQSAKRQIADLHNLDAKASRNAKKNTTHWVVFFLSFVSEKELGENLIFLFIISIL